MHVRFGRPAEPQVETPSLAVPQPAADLPVTALTDDQHKKLSKDALEQAELRMRGEQLRELMITYPLRAEEMLRNGELFDDEPGHGADDDGDDGTS